VSTYRLLRVADPFADQSSRKIQRRNSEISDPIIVESQILVSMEAYFKSNVDEAYILALKFIHTFLTESPFLESFEIDNFILRNSRFLTRWQVVLSGHFVPLLIVQPVFGNATGLSART